MHCCRTSQQITVNILIPCVYNSTKLLRYPLLAVRPLASQNRNGQDKSSSPNWGWLKMRIPRWLAGIGTGSARQHGPFKQTSPSSRPVSASGSILLTQGLAQFGQIDNSARCALNYHNRGGEEAARRVMSRVDKTLQNALHAAAGGGSEGSGKRLGEMVWSACHHVFCFGSLLLGKCVVTPPPLQNPTHCTQRVRAT